MPINFYNQLEEPPNFDKEAQIHYGVISEHSLDPEACAEFYYEGVDIGLENYQTELKKRLGVLNSLIRVNGLTPLMLANLTALVDEVVSNSDKKWVEKELIEMFQGFSTEPDVERVDQLWQVIEQEVLDNDHSDSGDRDYYLEKEGYFIKTCLQSDLMVVKSPFFSYAPQCSPCVPNAGDLDSANADGGLKCYCFGHDWFEEQEAPYPVFSVATGKQVVVEEIKSTCPNCYGRGRDIAERIASVREVNLPYVIQEIRAGNIKVEDWSEVDGSFLCFRCKGSGFVTEKKEREID